MDDLGFICFKGIRVPLNKSNAFAFQVVDFNPKAESLWCFVLILHLGLRCDSSGLVCYVNILRMNVTPVVFRFEYSGRV
jgi:hypothetical protein